MTVRPWFRAACSLLLASSCTRDLEVPPLPSLSEPGTVFGRVVVASPGSAETVGVPGASISLQASTVAATAGDDGAFTLEGIQARDGVLLFQVDADHDGVFESQRSISLRNVGAGPGRSVNLGDVLMAKNARVHGRALLADKISAGGHLGTLVFVPGTPLATYSGDDGRYFLSQLAPGPSRVGFFHPGYAPQSADTIDLRSGEDFSLGDISLGVDDGTGTGSLEGTVGFSPVQESAAAATLELVNVTTAVSTAGTVAADGTFAVKNLRTGLYDIRARHAGYELLVVPNLAVFRDQATTVALVLSQRQSADGGVRPPAPDGGLSCVLNAECASNQWCDDGFCRTQCGSTATCTNGRVCDLLTRTCVVPCESGCPQGETCEPVSNACASACDVARPCPAGRVCRAGACAPQCLVAGDCGASNLSCQAGQCVSNGSCGSDLECASTQLCVGGVCAARPTAPGDGGYLCTMPCDCRTDETCRGGICERVAPPTVRVRADAGASLAAVLDGGRAGDVIALEADGVYGSSVPFVLTRQRVTLSGGYQQCSPTRWVYDDTARSTLSVDAGIALVVAGDMSSPLEDVVLRSLDVMAQTSNLSTYDAIDIDWTRRLKVEGVRSGFFAPAGVNGVHSALSCTQCEDVDVEGFSVLPSTFSGQLVGVRLASSSGTVAGFTLGARVHGERLTGVSADSLSGPVQISGSDIGQLTTTVSGNPAVGISVQNCGLNRADIDGNHVTTPFGASGGTSESSGIWVQSCAQAFVTNNTVDNRTVAVGTNTAINGIRVTGSGGEVKSNTVQLLNAAMVNGGMLSRGLYIEGPVANLKVEDNGVFGGTGGRSYHGIEVANVTSGPLELNRNTVDGGFTASIFNNEEAIAFSAVNVSAAAGMSVLDSRFKAPVTGMSSGAVCRGMSFDGATARVERCFMWAPGSGSASEAVGLDVTRSVIELYSSWVLGGVGNNSIGIRARQPGTLYAAGNTVDLLGTVNQAWALTCADPATTVYATSNLFGAGPSAASHRMVNGVAGCLDPLKFKNNYFWYAVQGGPRDVNDNVTLVALAATGVPDVRGNIIGDSVGCYVPAAGAPSYLLPAGSPCIDTGQNATRQNSTPVTLDFEGRMRHQGSAPDIGCYERQ